MIVERSDRVVYQRFFVNGEKDFVLFGSHSFALTGGEDDGVIFCFHRATFSHVYKNVANGWLTFYNLVVKWQLLKKI